MNDQQEVLEKVVVRPQHPTLALWASAVGFGVEGFDLLLLVFLLAPISAEFGLGTTRAGSLMTGTLIGAVTGGILFGLLGDVYGRVRVLTWTILCFGFFTALCAFAHGYWQLLFYRSCAGLGFGGEFGVGLALVAETWPAAMRTRVSSYVALGGQAGILTAALATPLLLPHIGWRGMFLLGVFPVLLSFGLRRVLPEPDVFLQAQETKRKEFPISALFRDRKTSKHSVGLIVLCSIQQIGYYGLMTWLPYYLMSRHGLGLTRSALWTAATVVGMSCGIWVFGQCADRVGRRPVFLIFMAGAATMVLVYAHLQSVNSLLIGGAVMGVFVNGMLGGYGALISDLYPSEVRSTAQNVFFNIGRAFGGLGPLLIGPLAARYSFTVAIGALAVLYLLDMVAFLVLLPKSNDGAYA